MFAVFIIFIVGLLLLMGLFICINLQKLTIFNKVNNKVLKYVLSFLPLILIFILFNYVNSVVIIFHIFLSLLLFKIIFYIIHLITKNEYKTNLIVIASLVFCFIYLSIGAYNDYHVVETKYIVNTDKYIDGDKFRIIQLTDSHVGTTFDGNGFKKHIDKISKIDSDIVVVTGDFVDDDTTKEDMVLSCKALGSLKPKYGVYFIYGNHDRGYYTYRNFSANDLVEELIKNNVVVLSDEVKEINDSIYLVGREDKTYVRKDIKELVSSLDKSKYIIDLNHQPNDYENEKNNVDLVLSGHTHGGQLFPLGYIGKLFNINDEFYGFHKRGNTTFIVSSGISDWAIDFKTGTRSEYTIIDIVGNNYE